LHNFYNYIDLPPLEQLTKQGDGVNISYEHLTKEVVDACHENGKIVSVWFDATVTNETVTMYKKMLDLGVDAFCSDWP
jgi:glycerophosphoryl diester phosphodiesterase